MVKVVNGKITATVELKIRGYLKRGDERTEIPLTEALEIIHDQLEYYSGSNDGSELLANVDDDQIKIH